MIRRANFSPWHSRDQRLILVVVHCPLYDIIFQCQAANASQFVAWNHPTGSIAHGPVVVKATHDLGRGFPKEGHVSVIALSLAHVLVQTLSVAVYLSPVGPSKQRRLRWVRTAIAGRFDSLQYIIDRLSPSLVLMIMSQAIRPWIVLEGGRAEQWIRRRQRLRLMECRHHYFARIASNSGDAAVTRYERNAAEHNDENQQD